MIGTLEEYPTKKAAENAARGFRLDLVDQGSAALVQITMKELVDHFSEHEHKERQFEKTDGSGQQLDHSGLYSRGRLIHGRSIHGDLPGHEGENLRRILEEYARKLDES